MAIESCIQLTAGNDCALVCAGYVQLPDINRAVIRHTEQIVVLEANIKYDSLMAIELRENDATLSRPQKNLIVNCSRCNHNIVKAIFTSLIEIQDTR